MNIWRITLLLSMTKAQYTDDYPCPSPCQCSAIHDGTEYIVDVICSVPYIKPNETNFSQLETNVTSVLHLDCSDVLHSHLGDKIFQHLYSFKAINIISCGFDTLEEYSLFGLKSLKELVISGARTLYVHEKAFERTPYLQRLTITSSGLRSFPVLHFLPSLVFVNFTNNNIRDLSNIGTSRENGIFQRLFVLILNNNKIREINVTFHSFMPVVKYVAIADNLVSYVSSTSFHRLIDLEFLDLSGNNLLTLESNMFSDNVNLKVVGLSINPILQIPNGLFNSMKNIQILDLHLTNVGDTVWDLIKTITHVHEVQLAGCGITCINGSKLQNLTRLKYLDMNDNNITEILDHTFADQLKLETLKLANNKIKFVAANAFAGLQSLKSLDLRRNNINLIPSETFQFLPSLNLLNISYNMLKRFPTLVNCSDLFVIDLRHNRIDSLSNDSFKGLTNLGGINMDWNSIENIPRNLFKPTPVLQLIRMSNNDVRVISRTTFKGLNNLKWIFLDHNKINDISYVFTELPSLIQLDLSHNTIKGFIHSEYFYQSISLQEIYLSFNKISGISAKTFYNLINLDVVDLKYNRISTISLKSLSFPTLANRSPVFHLVGNPFVCDCHLEWMRKCVDRWTSQCKGFDIHEFEFLTCYRGYRIKSFSLIKDTAIENMLCEYKDHCNDMCKCCSSEECDCRISCPKNCSCLMSFSRERGIADCSRQDIQVMNQSIPSVTVILYLDGNKFALVTENMFDGLFLLQRLYLNGSEIYHVKDYSFSTLKTLKILFLNDNNIKEIGQNLLSGLVALEYINLEDNQISFIAINAFAGSPQLKSIRLANNKLVSPAWNLTHLNGLEYLTLGNNQWSCDCIILEHLKTLTYTMANIIKDRDEMYCTTNRSQNFTSVSIVQLDLPTLCPNQTHLNFTVELSNHLLTRHVQALVTVLVMFVLVVTISIIIFINRKLIQVVLYNKFGFRFGREKTDVNKIVDAFVSYSHKDEHFVVRELLPRLETEEGYKLCVHFRDFPVGATIADTIIDSIENSQRTILVVSNNFLDSEWCQYEFKTAHHGVLKEKSKKIILILMDNIDSSKFDEELKLYMKTKTYLKYRDPWFWEKLIYAMPEIQLKTYHQLNDMNKVREEVVFDVQREARLHKNII